MSCGEEPQHLGFGTVKPRPWLSLNDLQGWNISHSTRMCLKRSKALDKVSYEISQASFVSSRKEEHATREYCGVDPKVLPYYLAVGATSNLHPYSAQWLSSSDTVVHIRITPSMLDSSQTLMPATSDSGIASSSSTPRHPRHRRTSGIPIQASTAQVEGSIPLCSSGFLSRRVITCLFQTQTLTIPNPSHRTLRMGNPFCKR